MTATLEQRAVEVEQLEDEVLEFVFARDLTPEELRASRLPINDSYTFFVEFDYNGRLYRAVHDYFVHSTVTLSSERGICPRRDFFEVAEIVMGEVGGSRWPVKTEGDKLDTTIRGIKKHSHAEVADILERYQQHFSNVRTQAHFIRIPRSAYENSGLPQGKLAWATGY